jgi:DNA-binding LytR/AlgR family response regulator
MNHRFIVVDDEPLARKLIINFTARIEGLEFSGEFGGALDAGNFLRNNSVDLIFLDVQMPELDGFQFLDTLKKRPAVILTTAHRDYAPEAFAIEAVDYLLKPISFERLIKGVNRYFERVVATPRGPGLATMSNSTENIIYIKADRKMNKIAPDQILYIESLDEYVKIHLPGRFITSRENISTLATRLRPDHFIRIHRSFIVSKYHIVAVAADGVEIGGKLLPFGRAFKLSALAALGVAGFS